MSKKTTEFTDYNEKDHRLIEFSDQQKELLIAIIDRKLLFGIDNYDLKQLSLCNTENELMSMTEMLDELASIKELIKETL